VRPPAANLKVSSDRDCTESLLALLLLGSFQEVFKFAGRNPAERPLSNSLSHGGILMAKPGLVRIVFAEDSNPDVVLVKEILRAEGIEVEWKVFPDGKECAAYLRTDQEPPNAIIFDLNLPRVDGFELLRLVRGDRRYAHVPVAVLTSSRLAADRQRALNLGANAFITKPNTLDGFVETVGPAIHGLLGATGCLPAS
jgi:CheY-like chemotaxis protein